ncbi:MAG: carboxypeptidase regulatory-like domain-containing protein, partial [Geminicoccaceae bacterium]
VSNDEQTRDEQGDMDSSHARGVVGKVIASADDQPIADVIINVKSLDQPSTLIPERIVLSEANGQYYWPLGPGNYELSVKAAGYEPMTGRVQVEEAGPAILDFRLEKIE